jgi:hypothetical protein
MKNSEKRGDFNWGGGDKNNIEELMDKVEKLSIDWDNFEEAHNTSKQSSNADVSDLFNRSKQSSERHSRNINHEDSRDVM